MGFGGGEGGGGEVGWGGDVREGVMVLDWKIPWVKQSMDWWRWIWLEDM